MNVCVFSGNLTRDAELRYVGDNSVLSFTLAVSKKIKDKEYTEFLEFDLWGSRADSLAPYLKKGQGLIVNASARQQVWEKDGQRKSRISFVVNELDFNGKGSGGKKQKPVSVGVSSDSSEFEDDIPF